LADLILPSPSHLERSEASYIITMYMIENGLRYSPAVFDLPQGAMGDYEAILGLCSRMSGRTAAEIDIEHFTSQLDLLYAVAPRKPRRESREEIIDTYGRQPGDAKFYDLMIRCGRFGDAYGGAEGLTLEKVKGHPHGINLGPMMPRLPEMLATPDRKIRLAPKELVEDMARLRREMASGRFAHDGLTLIGRRQLRSVNSWFHNLERLQRGSEGCNLWMNPDDAARRGLQDGQLVRITSRVGSIVVPLQISLDMSASVVCLPHGWGHNGAGMGQKIAGRNPGVCSNHLTDEDDFDAPSGTSVLNGIPVDVSVA
jgi:anaerobic selenocysteine-containing dehydrogenase